MMMKKSILLIALLVSFSGAYAQKSKVNNAESLLNSQKLDEALDAINIAIDPNNEKSEKINSLGKNMGSTWRYLLWNI